MEVLIMVLSVIGAIVVIALSVVAFIFLYEKYLDYRWHINYAKHREHFSSQVKGISHWFSADIEVMKLIQNIGQMQNDFGYLDGDVLRNKYREDKSAKDKSN